MRLSAGVLSAARATLATAFAGVALAALAAPAGDTLDVTSDGPIAIDLIGCNRTIQAG